MMGISNLNRIERLDSYGSKKNERTDLAITRESLVLEINSSVEKEVLNVNPKQTSRNLSDSREQSYNLNVQKS